MVQIVKFTEEDLNKIPTIRNHLIENFGNDCESIKLYAVMVDGKFSFLAQRDAEFVYFRLEKSAYQQVKFNLDIENSGFSLKKGEYEVFFDGEYKFVSRAGIEAVIDLQPIEEDEDGYNADVFFEQYNPFNDVNCRISYQHTNSLVNGRRHIYEMHTKSHNFVSIKEDYMKDGYEKIGLLPKKAHYYYRESFESGSIFYGLTALREFGLREFLKNGSYELLRDDNLVRYFRVRYITKDGFYKSSFPFEKALKKEEIDDLITNYGFKTKIPKVILDVYNGDDRVVDEIREISQELLNVINNEDKNSFMELKLVP